MTPLLDMRGSSPDHAGRAGPMLPAARPPISRPIMEAGGSATTIGLFLLAGVIIAFAWPVTRLIVRVLYPEFRHRKRYAPHDAETGCSDVYQASFFHGSQHITGRQQDHAQ